MVSRIVGGIIGRIMYVTYPVLVFGIALTAWSSSNLSDAFLGPPLIGDGFNSQNSCYQDANKKLNRACFRTDGFIGLDQTN